jgi:hypothetical protein
MTLDPKATRVLNLLLLALGTTAASIGAASATVAFVGHPERADWLLYLGALGVVLPLAFYAAWRIAEQVPARLGVVALASVAGFALLLAVLRIAYGLGATGLASGPGLLAGSLLLLAIPFLLARRDDALEEADASRAPATIAAAGLLAVAVLVFAPPGDLSAKNLTLSLLIAAAVSLAYVRLRPWKPGPGIALTLDVVTVLLIALVAIDASGYLANSPPELASIASRADLLSSIQLHQDFYLAPANDVLHGKALLVDSASQYGVGSIYLLSAWFKLAPIGYGTLAILIGLLTAVQYVVAWAIMRVAGCGRLLAALGAFAALAVTLLGSLTNPGFFPSFSALRFLLPFAAGLLGLRAASGPSGNPLSAPVLAVTAVASIWSIETFVYTLATVTALAAVDAATRAPSLRVGVRLFARGLVLVGIVCVTAHVAFALGTRILAGDWPDWGWYLSYFGTYSVQGYQSLPVQAWSTGFFVAGFYVTSVAGLITLLAGAPDTARRERLALLAIAAITAAGIGMLTYWVARSVDSTLTTLSFPAVVTAVIWLGLLLRLSTAQRGARILAVAVSTWISALVIVAGWSITERNWDRSALAHLLPGGDSLSGDLERLWDSPPMDPRAPEAQRLIETRFPHTDSALVMIEPDLGVEALIRSRRTNLLPIGDPTEDSIAIEHSLPLVMEGVRDLQPGTLMLVQHHPIGRGAPEPSVAIALTRSFGVMAAHQWLTYVQVHALRAIRQRFRLRPVESGSYGLEVVSLAPRRPPGSPPASAKPRT